MSLGGPIPAYRRHDRRRILCDAIHSCVSLRTVICDGHRSIDRERINMMVDHGGQHRLDAMIGEKKPCSPTSSSNWISIVTTRNAPSHERELNTVKRWSVMANDAFFLGVSRKERFSACSSHMFSLTIRRTIFGRQARQHLRFIFLSESSINRPRQQTK
jgi:hypothetical protein